MCTQDRRDRRWPARVVQRVGRRGAFLLLLGIIFILRGDTLVAIPLTDTEAEIYEYALHLFSARAWGVLYISAGLLATGAAFVHTRDRRYSDAVGFAALQGVSLAWMFSVWLSAVIGDGGALAVRKGLTWMLVVAAIALISGWEEAPK